MTYKLILTPEAQKHLDDWAKSGQVKTMQKIGRLLEELSRIRQLKKCYQNKGNRILLYS